MLLSSQGGGGLGCDPIKVRKDHAGPELHKATAQRQHVQGRNGAQGLVMYDLRNALKCVFRLQSPTLVRAQKGAVLRDN